MPLPCDEPPPGPPTQGEPVIVPGGIDDTVEPPLTSGLTFTVTLGDMRCTNPPPPEPPEPAKELAVVPVAPFANT